MKHREDDLHQPHERLVTAPGEPLATLDELNRFHERLEALIAHELPALDLGEVEELHHELLKFATEFLGIGEQEEEEEEEESGGRAD